MLSVFYVKKSSLLQSDFVTFKLRKHALRYWLTDWLTRTKLDCRPSNLRKVFCQLIMTRWWWYGHMLGHICRCKHALDIDNSPYSNGTTSPHHSDGLFLKFFALPNQPLLVGWFIYFFYTSKTVFWPPTSVAKQNTIRVVAWKGPLTPDHCGITKIWLILFFNCWCLHQRAGTQWMLFYMVDMTKTGSSTPF